MKIICFNYKELSKELHQLLLVVLLLFIYLNVNGQIINWTGAVDNEWTNPANWNPMMVPTANDDVILNATVRVPQVTTDDAVARTVEINNVNFYISNGGLLTIDAQNGANIDDGMFINSLQNSKLIIEKGGELIIRNAVDNGIEIDGKSADNSGKITIENCGDRGIFVYNFGRFHNEVCGHLDSDEELIFAGGLNAAKIDNEGSIILRDPAEGSFVSLNTIATAVIHDLGGAGVFVNPSPTGIVDKRAIANYWKGCEDTDWDNPFNWSRNRVPIAGDSVVIRDRTFDPFLGGTTPDLMHVEVRTDAKLTILFGGELNLDGTPSADFLYGLYLRGGEVQNEAVVNIANYDKHGPTIFDYGVGIEVADDGSSNIGTFTNQGSVFLTDCEIGITQKGGGSHIGVINENLIDIQNVDESIFILGVMVNEPCGILKSDTEVTSVSPQENMNNKGVMIITGGGVTNIDDNSMGIIHELGTGSVDASVGGIVDTNPNAIYWTACHSIFGEHWSEQDNWSQRRVPIASDSVIVLEQIDNPFVDINNAVAMHIEVKSLASLDILPDSKLTIDGTPTTSNNVHGIDNNGSVNIQVDGELYIQNTSKNGILNKGLVNNAGIVDISSYNTFGIANFSSGTFINSELLIIKNTTTETSILNSNGNFFNGGCSSIFADHHFENYGLFTNDGYIDYPATDYFTTSGSTFTDSGHQHDPNGVLPNGATTVEIPSITHEEYNGDNDYDGQSYCGGDVDDIFCGLKQISISPPDNFGSGDNHKVETDGTITADNLIGDGADIIYDALDYIELLEDFEVELGAIFLAAPDGCAGLLLRDGPEIKKTH